MSRLAIETRLDVSAQEIATRSWNVLTSPPGPVGRVAILTVSTVAAGEGAVVLGRFQRLGDAAGFHRDAPRLRRASGGTHLWLADGTVHVLLALASPDALVACTPTSVVNRHVRPVLRAIGGAYFGRDWIAGARGGEGGSGRVPIAFAGFAHEARSGRAALEVVLPASADWCEPARASHRGLTPAHLDEPTRHVEAIVAAFEAAFGAADRLSGEGGPVGDEAPAADPTPWSASVDEAIGPVRAGRDARGILQLGGELFASVDRLDSLGAAVDADPDAAGALVDAAFTDGGVVGGVNDLAHVRDVLLEARLKNP